MTRILYWNNMPAPYMVGRFNALSKRADVDLRCLFTERRGATRSWSVDEGSWEFDGEYIPTQATTLSAKVGHFKDLLRRHRPDAIVGQWSEPLYVRGFAAAVATSVPYVFRVLPSYEAWFKPRAERELLKHAMFRTAAGATCSSGDAVERAQGYGMAPSRLHLATQSIDLELFHPTGAERSWTCPRVGFVGRLVPEKGLDLLMGAMELIRVAHPGAELRICGDGELESEVRRIATSDTSTSHLGYLEGPALVDFYNSVDVLAFPTTGDPHGLVVEEALACGVPVVSSMTAGGITERIIDGANGYIIGPRTPLALANGVCAALARREQMAPLCRPSVAHRTHARWASEVQGAAEAAASAGNARPSQGVRHLARWVS